MKTLALLLIFLSLPVQQLRSEPISHFFDGSDSRNECKARLDRRLTGFSGLLYSHSKYGKELYNSSRNCVLMLVAPLGYHIRVRALQFDVTATSNTRQCEKDTLHVFDHETTFDPESHSPPRIDDIISPGPIIGQFCGHFENKILNVSTNNAMTLWWHANPSTSGHPSKGFKLHWGSYRVSQTGNCVTGEFSCGNGECIPIESACDKYADCSNGEDLVRSRQMAANCQNIELDPLTTVSGVFVLLFSAAIILSICGLMMFICCLCRCLRSETPMKGATSQSTTTDYKPEPPQFYPPSPPKMPPPSAASSFTPRKQQHHHFDGPLVPSEASGFHAMRMGNQYGAPSDINGDYAYVRNDVHRNLL